jgi:muramoyltetrapeptide carboxypeptidase LdcA involved in peptidoglycan recycling
VSVDKKRKIFGGNLEVFDKLIELDGCRESDGKIPSVIWLK